DLAAACDQQIRLEKSWVMPPELESFSQHIDRILRRPAAGSPPPPSAPIEHLPLIVPGTGFRFYPQMIRWAVEEIKRLVNQDGVPPGEIAVLAPFVSDALRFSLQTGLNEAGIELTTHRPS